MTTLLWMNLRTELLERSGKTARGASAWLHQHVVQARNKLPGNVIWSPARNLFYFGSHVHGMSLNCICIIGRFHRGNNFFPTSKAMTIKHLTHLDIAKTMVFHPYMFISCQKKVTRLFLLLPFWLRHTKIIFL
uniref:Uncharacterized protein n=1 Tax=Oryza brachyantha TaxID=4533 RepID=J3N1D5_ORYBR